MFGLEESAVALHQTWGFRFENSKKIIVTLVPSRPLAYSLFWMCSNSASQKPIELAAPKQVKNGNSTRLRPPSRSTLLVAGFQHLSLLRFGHMQRPPWISSSSSRQCFHLLLQMPGTGLQLCIYKEPRSPGFRISRITGTWFHWLTLSVYHRFSNPKCPPTKRFPSALSFETTLITATCGMYPSMSVSIKLKTRLNLGSCGWNHFVFGVDTKIPWSIPWSLKVFPKIRH